jgi:hypothetical protein
LHVLRRRLFCRCTAHFTSDEARCASVEHVSCIQCRIFFFLFV